MLDVNSYNDADGLINTMENNNPIKVEAEEMPEVQSEPKEDSQDSPTPDSSEEATPEGAVSSSKEEVDYQALIEEEKKAGEPDPQKAYERFKKKQERQQQPESYDEPESEEDELDRPLTKREAREFFERQRQQVILQTNQDRLQEYARSVADSDSEAEYVLAVHANRVFPETMSLKEQIAEAHAIANYKRVQAKNRELARAVQSQRTVGRETATTQRDAQPTPTPNLASDMKASLQRAGFTWSGEHQRYEKKLPNGKILATKDGKNPQLVN